MRPDIDATEGDRDRVREYADEHGITMPRAWAEIIREGIDAVDNDEESDNDTRIQH